MRHRRIGRKTQALHDYGQHQPSQTFLHHKRGNERVLHNGPTRMSGYRQHKKIKEAPKPRRLLQQVA